MADAADSADTKPEAPLISEDTAGASAPAEDADHVALEMTPAAAPSDESAPLPASGDASAPAAKPKAKVALPKVRAAGASKKLLSISGTAVSRREAGRIAVAKSDPLLARPELDGAKFFEILVTGVASDSNVAHVGFGICLEDFPTSGSMPGWIVKGGDSAGALSYAYHMDDGWAYGANRPGFEFGPFGYGEDRFGCGITRSGDVFFTRHNVFLGVAFRGANYDAPWRAVVALSRRRESVILHMVPEWSNGVQDSVLAGSPDFERISSLVADMRLQVGATEAGAPLPALSGELAVAPIFFPATGEGVHAMRSGTSLMFETEETLVDSHDALQERHVAQSVVPLRPTLWYADDPDQHHLLYWECTVDRIGLDGSIGIGIAPYYPNPTMIQMPGWTKDSFGYHGDDGYVWVAGEARRYPAPFAEPGRTIGVVVDPVAQELWFTWASRFGGHTVTAGPPISLANAVARGGARQIQWHAVVAAGEGRVETIFTPSFRLVRRDGKAQVARYEPPHPVGDEAVLSVAGSPAAAGAAGDEDDEKANSEAASAAGDATPAAAPVAKKPPSATGARGKAKPRSAAAAAAAALATPDRYPLSIRDYWDNFLTLPKGAFSNAPAGFRQFLYDVDSDDDGHLSVQELRTAIFYLIDRSVRLLGWEARFPSLGPLDDAIMRALPIAKTLAAGGGYLETIVDSAKVTDQIDRSIDVLCKSLDNKQKSSFYRRHEKNPPRLDALRLELYDMVSQILEKHQISVKKSLIALATPLWVVWYAIFLPYLWQLHQVRYGSGDGASGGPPLSMHASSKSMAHLRHTGSASPGSPSARGGAGGGGLASRGSAGGNSGLPLPLRVAGSLIRFLLFAGLHAAVFVNLIIFYTQLDDAERDSDVLGFLEAWGPVVLMLIVGADVGASMARARLRSKLGAAPISGEDWKARARASISFFTIHTFSYRGVPRISVSVVVNRLLRFYSPKLSTSNRVIAFALAVLHSVIPGVYREADSDGDHGFIPEGSAMSLIALVHLLVSVPLTYYVITRMFEVASDYDGLASSLQRMSDFCGADTSYQWNRVRLGDGSNTRVLPGYMDLETDQNLDGFLTSRDELRRRGVDPKNARWTPPLFLAVILLGALLVVRVATSGRFSIMNYMLTLDLVIVVAVCGWILAYLVRANSLLKGRHMTNVTDGMERTDRALREQAREQYQFQLRQRKMERQARLAQGGNADAPMLATPRNLPPLLRLQSSQAAQAIAAQEVEDELAPLDLSPWLMTTRLRMEKAFFHILHVEDPLRVLGFGVTQELLFSSAGVVVAGVIGFASQVLQLDKSLAGSG